MRETVIQELGAGSLFAVNFIVLDETDSTNTRLKTLAAAGAPEGTVVVARRQTGGRGTHGRSFCSPEGGLYLSVLLRPKAELKELLSLTGRAACAVRRAIEAASGAPVSIKWLNDIFLNGRKICGILAEVQGLRADGTAEGVVLGVGVNAAQQEAEFREAGLEQIATSLAAEGYPVTPERLCAAILRELEEMYRAFPAGLEDCLKEYRAHCITVGRRVEFHGEGTPRQGVAEEVEEDFTLRVRTPDGKNQSVASGMVTLL